jgi:hypothetical protein
MRPTRFAEKELELICPRYFPYFDDLKTRWTIRKWHSLQRKRYPLLNSDLIYIAKREDDEGNDIGYSEIDAQIITTVRIGFYYATKAKELSAQIDYENEQMQAREDEEVTYQFRSAAESIWRHYKEPSIDLGRRGAR